MAAINDDAIQEIRDAIKRVTGIGDGQRTGGIGERVVVVRSAGDGNRIGSYARSYRCSGGGSRRCINYRRSLIILKTGIGDGKGRIGITISPCFVICGCRQGGFVYGQGSGGISERIVVVRSARDCDGIGANIGSCNGSG